ncbi:MAG: hypothetical protein ACRELF_25260, partial [Gemmataceae bacterium]
GWLALTAVVAGIALVGCSDYPNRAACADPGTLSVISSLIDSETTSTEADEEASGQVTRGDDVRAALGLLNAQKGYKFDDITMSSYDPKTRKIGCSAAIEYSLEPEDRSKKSAEIIHSLLNESDFLDFSNSPPQSEITYSIVPSAQDPSQNVETLDSNDVPYVLVAVAMARVQIAKGSY